MPKSVPIPHLSKKLDLLFGHDPDVRTQEDLAKQLNIDPSQISRWKSGGDYGEKRAGKVPGHHVDQMSEIFKVSAEWLRGDKQDDETEGQYHARLKSELRACEPRSEWQKLFMEAEVSGLLSVRRANAKGSFRGLAPEDRPDGFLGKSFHVGERVYVELKLSPPWESRGGGPLAHVVLLMMDGARITCLWPSEMFGSPAHEVAAPRVTIPKDAPVRALKVTEPIGVQSLFAVLTSEPLPSALVGELMSLGHPDLRPCLARMTTELQGRPAGEWYCLKQLYYVEQPR